MGKIFQEDEEKDEDEEGNTADMVREHIEQNLNRTIPYDTADHTRLNTEHLLC